MAMSTSHHRILGVDISGVTFLESVRAFFDSAGGASGLAGFGVTVLEIMSQTSDEHFWFCGKYLLLALMSMWCRILSDVNAYCMFASKLV